MARCLAARPDDRLRARFAQALADAGAAEPALRRIHELERDGTIDRLDRPEASALLVSGSILLLESGAPAAALPWAQRALDLDPRNASAARIVRALSARGASAPTTRVVRGG
jgi:hypothetical protein